MRTELDWFDAVWVVLELMLVVLMWWSLLEDPPTWLVRLLGG